MPKTLRVAYYAILREQRGLSEETLNTDADTPAALYEELRARHGFTLDAPQLKVVVNQAFVPWDTPLQSHDEIVFIPPVAGG